MCFTPRASAVLGHRLGLFSSESTETMLRMRTPVYVQRLSAAQLSVTVLPTPCSADTGGFRSSYRRLEKKLVLTPRSVLHVWRCGLGLVTGLLLSLFPFPSVLYSCFDNLGFFSWLFPPHSKTGRMVWCGSSCRWWWIQSRLLFTWL